MTPYSATVAQALQAQALGEGHDPEKAKAAIEAGMEFMAREIASTGKIRNRAQSFRSQERRLRKHIAGAIGLTLMTWLISWALGKALSRLLEWAVAKFSQQAATMSIEEWTDCYG